MKSTRTVIGKGHQLKVKLELGHDALGQTYYVHAAGRTHAEILAECRRIEEHHAKKGDLFAEVSTLWARSFTSHGRRFILRDVAIRERGTDVELFLKVVDEAGNEALPGMPLRMTYGTIDEMPRTEGIVSLVQTWLDGHTAEQKAHEEFRTQLNAVLGVGG